MSKKTVIKISRKPLILRYSLPLGTYLQVWDLRKNDMLYRMRGHSDTVTGMQLSPDGSYLLSNAMDNTGNQTQKRPRLWYKVL